MTTDPVLDNGMSVGDALDPTGWGRAVSNAIAAITAGYASIDCSAASPIALTADQYVCPVLVLTGVLPADLNLIFPVLLRRWKVVNNTTGAHAVTCKTSGGSGVTVLQGGSRDIWGDGTNILGAPHAIAGTIAIDPASIAAGATGVPTFSLAQALTSDLVTMNLPASFEAGLVFGGAFVSAAGTVSVRLGNVTSGAIDGSSRTWSYCLWRF